MNSPSPIQYQYNQMAWAWKMWTTALARPKWSRRYYETIGYWEFMYFFWLGAVKGIPELQQPWYLTSIK